MIRFRLSRTPRLAAALLAGVAFVSTGCVSQQAYDDLVSINRQLEERRVALEAQLAEREQTIAELNAAISGMNDQGGANAALRSLLEQERQKVAAVRAELAALQQQMAALGNAEPEVIVIDSLPQEVSDALRDLAAANPDLMIYDASRGMIRLRSDLTFALGSADVNDAAKTALGRLAGVLNSSAASGFGIQVVGHTDAVPVKSARGRQLFIDNRGLSSNRGDAVARVLVESGVAAGRILSGGRGETQPIAPNDARGQSQANRRVEIFLVKQSDSPAAQPGPAPQQRPAADGGGEVIEGVAEPQDDSVFK